MYFLKKTSSTQPQLNIDIQLETLPGSTAYEQLVRCDWGTLFKCTASQSTTVKLVEIKKGQTVVVVVKSTANNVTMNFQYYDGSTYVSVVWLNGANNGGTLSNNEVSVYTFTMIDNIVYGSSSKNEASGISLLDQLQDVTITSPSNGQILLFNGTQWVNSDITSINNQLYIKSLYSGEQTLSSTDIDWEQGNSFNKTLTGGETYTFSNEKNGQMISVSLTAPSTDVVVTWPSSVIWVNGEQSPIRLKANSKTIFKFLRINNITYGTIDREYGASFIRGVISSPVSLVDNTVDCDVGSYFTRTITGNTTLMINNLTSGQCVCFAITSSGGDYTVIFNVSGATVKWANNDIQNTISNGKTNIYVLLRINNNVYVSYSNNY